ncbi:hypothetical protein Tco_0012539 [Tanacetum coccineum]
MAIETKKNGASESTVINENRGRDDARQNPKKRGLDSDFTSMREDFRVALNTLSGDLMREIHDLRDLFIGEISKIREEFGEEVSTLHQVIEDFQADMVCASDLWLVAATTLTMRCGRDVGIEISSEILELSNQDSLFYLLDGLEGWAKTELKQRGVQDLAMAIAHVKAFSA